MVKWGVQLVTSEPPRTPGYYNMTGTGGYLSAYQLTKTLCSQYRTKTKRAGMPAYGQVGSATGDQ